LYIADTGNKRIAIFDAEGNFVSQFGTTGLEPGQFDEPVGLAVDQDGRVYVADTWNLRMQAMAPDQNGTVFSPLTVWDINGWKGQSLDNKPFVAVDNNQNVYVTDPEGYRILQFSSSGKFIRTWGDFSTGTDGIGLASGVAVDTQGNIWVTDAGNMRILRFTLPKP
jgi:DNA-binding beta-propeller fold protein YncE